MSARDHLAHQALKQVQELQQQGRSFESIAAVLTAFPLKAPAPEEQAAEIARLNRELAAERAARVAAEAVLADRCRELMELREAHDLANATVRALESRLSALRPDPKHAAAKKGWWGR